MISIRDLTPDEMLRSVKDLQSYAFMASPPLENDEDWNEYVRGDTTLDCLAAFENENAVAVIASGDMTQNVRGNLYPAGGIWGVAADPSARRKGLVRQLMTKMMDKTRQKGHAFTLLYPFRESFYARLGYTAFPVPCYYSFSPEALAPLLKSEPGGQIQRTLIRDGLETYDAFIHEMHLHTHGMALFTHPDSLMAKKNRTWLAVARAGGAVTGVMLYKIKGPEDGDKCLQVSRFYTSSVQGRYQLLQYLALHIDQVSEVEMLLSPFERPETWLPDLELKVKYYFAPAMARVLDVTRLAGMPVGLGGFSVYLNDPICPWNDGVWAFESQDGVLGISPAAVAECSLSINGLNALVFGSHLPEVFPFRGWGDPKLDVQARMLALFPPVQPFMHSQF